jgi:hypothetical protein
MARLMGHIYFYRLGMLTAWKQKSF